MKNSRKETADSCDVKYSERNYLKEVPTMAIDITAVFGPEFAGTLQTARGTAAIGREAGELLPYDMLLGALAACYYSTFLDIMKKKRVTYDSCEIKVQGVKREAIPATLETVSMNITVYGAEQERGFHQAAELAAKYCSVYQTIAEVAEMNYTLAFKASPDSTVQS